MKVLVIDDERPALDELTFLLGRDPRIGEVLASDSATEALRVLQDEEVDAVFLDIQMPGLTGLDLAQVLSRFKSPPPVVFVTAHEEHAVAAFELRAVDYVLKPVREERLAEAVRRVVEAGGPAPSGDVQIPVERGGVTRFISRSEITHVEAQGDYARLHTADGSHLVRTPLSSLAEQWASAGFVRIHRSVLVALPHVEEVRSEGGRGQRRHRRHRAAGQPPPHPRAARRCSPAARREPSAVSDQPPPRVRVTGPPRRRADVVRPAGTREIDAETALGEVFMRSLLREQLCLALRVLAALALTLGMLPLLFHLFPSLGDVRRGPDAAGLAAARACSPTRGWWCSAGSTSGAPRTTSATSPTWSVGPTAPTPPTSAVVTTDVVPGVVAVVLVSIATLVIGTWGLRISRTTSDFFVASRTVRPRLNASAIGGEYLSAASFLGVAGLLLTFGAEMLWYPIGWTAGYLVLLVLVAAPLRRSGAYTLPDFAEARLGSRGVRKLCSVLVVAIGWLYLLPQFQGAGVTLRSTIGAPPWAGSLVVAIVVLASVSPGGMRSITFVQAFQYWLKLTALLVPAFVLLAVWLADGAADPAAAAPGARGRSRWRRPAAASGSTRRTPSSSRRSSARWACRTWSCASTPTPTAALLVVRRSRCSALLGIFYVLPPVYAALGRIYAPSLIDGRSDVLVLELPSLMVGGAVGAVLTGARHRRRLRRLPLHQLGPHDRGGRGAVAGRDRPAVGPHRLGGVAAFRVAAAIAVVVPLLLSLPAQDVAVARTVGLAFAVTASTFCAAADARDLVARADARRARSPGCWSAGSGRASPWPGRSPRRPPPAGPRRMLGQPAAWSVPASFLTMVVVSRLTRDSRAGPRGPLHGPPPHPRGRRAPALSSPPPVAGGRRTSTMKAVRRSAPQLTLSRTAAPANCLR